jgi:hypothetical protein
VLRADMDPAEPMNVSSPAEGSGACVASLSPRRGRANASRRAAAEFPRFTDPQLGD